MLGGPIGHPTTCMSVEDESCHMIGYYFSTNLSRSRNPRRNHVLQSLNWLSLVTFSLVESINAHCFQKVPVWLYHLCFNPLKPINKLQTHPGMALRLFWAAGTMASLPLGDPVRMLVFDDFAVPKNEHIVIHG